MVFSIISKPYNECEFCFFDNVFVGIIQLLGDNARKNSSQLPVKKIDCFFDRSCGFIAMTEGVCFISWIPAYAGMTKDYWIAW
jgi:hypothetical protein